MTAKTSRSRFKFQLFSGSLQSQKKRRMSSTQGDSLRKYDVIPLENRKTLVRFVIDQERSISKSAKRLGIKLSTAKLIIKKYKESGSFFEKKCDRENRQRTELKLVEQNRNDLQGIDYNAPSLDLIANYPQVFRQAFPEQYPFVNTFEPNFYVYNFLPHQMYWM